jgi:hypothetical protein
LNDKEKKNLLRTFQRKEKGKNAKFSFSTDFITLVSTIYRNGYRVWGSENSSGGGCQPLDKESVMNICQGFMTNKLFSTEKNINILWVLSFIIMF